MKKHWGLDFVTLELVLAAAETGSITSAAAANHLALAAASRRIAEFESRIGVRVFQRLPRGVRLSAGGQAMLSGIKQLVADANNLAHTVEDIQHGTRDHLRLLANYSVIAEFLPGLLARFSAAHPHVRIEVEELNSPEIVSALVERRATMGAIWAGVDTQGLAATPLGTDEITLVVPRQHVLARRRVVRFVDTLPYDYVMFEGGSPLYLLLGVEASRVNSALKGRIRVRGFDALFRMVSAGLGIGIAPQRVARPFATSLPFTLVRLREDWARMNFCAVYRSLSELAPIERSFLSFAEAGTY